MLNITEVRLKKIGKGNFLGFAAVTISDSIVIGRIKLFKGKDGKFIVMPGNRIKGHRKLRHFAFPINEETRLQLLDAIIKKYDEEISKETKEIKD